MKKFKFRLQRVMDAKENEEKQQQRIFGMAQQRVVQAELELEELQRQLEEQIQQELANASSAVRVSDAMMGTQWKAYLRRCIIAQNSEIARRREKADVEHQKLVEISRERQILEKLRDKRKIEHQTAVLHEEQKIIDEIGGRSRKYGLQE
ncbi:flagellar export protein FliJ [bacterium]|nr:flagellar export protein FliJ [bacterium]